MLALTGKFGGWVSECIETVSLPFNPCKSLTSLHFIFAVALVFKIFRVADHRNGKADC